MSAMNDDLWDQKIEENFKNFELTEPPAHVIASVQKMAAKEVKPGVLDFLKQRLQAFATSPQWAWMTAICLVVGLTIIMKQAQSPVTQNGMLAQDDSQVESVSDEPVVEAAANFSGPLTKTLLKPVDIKKEVTKAFDDYTKALSFYHQKNFVAANQLFGQIVKAHPRFEKKQELYTYWIKTLDEMGDFEAADTKREELRQLRKF